MPARLSLSLLLVVALTASAQDFPTRPVTIVVPFSAGGPTDIVARQLAISMAKPLGQAVIVQNRPSSGGIVGAEFILQSPADGYALMIHNIGMSTLPALHRALRFNPLSDFDFVGQVVDVPMALVGKKDLPPEDFQQLKSWLDTNQRIANLGNAGPGTASHLCGLLFMSRLGTKITEISYKGVAPALNDLQGGQIDLVCDQTTTTAPLIRSGRVKVFGTTTRQRLVVLPEVPTLAEQGLESFEVSVWHGLYAPKNTPKPILDKLVSALQVALVDPSFREAMIKLGAIVVSPDRASPEGLRKHLSAEIAKWTPIIRESGRYLD